VTVSTGDQINDVIHIDDDQTCLALSSFIIKDPTNRIVLPLRSEYYQDKYRYFIEITNLNQNAINTEFSVKYMSSTGYSITKATRLYKNIFYFDVGINGLAQGTDLAVVIDTPHSGGGQNYLLYVSSDFDFESPSTAISYRSVPFNRVVDSYDFNFQILLKSTSASTKDRCVVIPGQVNSIVYPALGNPINYTMVALFSRLVNIPSTPIDIAYLGWNYQLYSSQITFTPGTYNPSPYSFGISSSPNSGDSPFVFIQINFKTNPFDSLYLNSIHLEYPFGYNDGNRDAVRLCIIIPHSKWLTSIISTLKWPTDAFNQILALTPTLTDTIKPQLVSLELIYYPLNRILVKAAITDDQSGFLKLSFGNAFEINAKDLSGGNLLNGVYESLVEYKIGSSPFPVILYDNANNTVIFNEKSIYNVEKMTKIPTIPYGRQVLAKDFTTFYFKSSDVDVSNGIQQNSLYFNFPESNSQSLVKFTPIFSFNTLSMEFPWVDITFNGSFNSTIQLFQVDFEIPARLFTGRIGYQLQIEGTTLSHIEIENYHSSAKLSVRSDSADMMPPMIINIDTTSTNFSIGWLITISDPINGFKKGSIHILPSNDLKDYVVEFTEKDRISGDIYIGVYNITYPYNPFTCRSQNFSIGKVMLMDQQNVIGSNYGFKDLYDPMVDFHGGTTPVLSCSSSKKDTTPPAVTSFSKLGDFNKTLDVGLLKDLTHDFYLVVQDSESGISPTHIPILYAVAHDNIVSQEFSIVDYNLNKAEYKVHIVLPYGFGFPNDIHFYVYGIVDLASNLGVYGISPKSQPEFVFSTTLNSIKQPWVESSLPITSKGGNLVIYGRNFGDSPLNRTSVSIDYQDGYGFLFISHTKISQVHLIIHGIKASYDPYKVKVTVDDIESNEYLVSPSYEYFEPAPPKVCPGKTECSGNGNCLNGQCICKSPYGGIDCSSLLIITLPPKVNATNPDTTPVIETDIDGKTVSLSGLISVVALREFSFKSELVKEYQFTKWLLTNQTNDSDPSYLYSTTFDNDQTNINVTIRYFTQATNITFANQVLYMSESTLKYQVDMSKYQFSSQLNYLQLIMSAKIQTQDQDSCSFTSYVNDTTSQYSLVQIDKVALLGRFIKRAIVDKVIKDISNDPLDETMSISKDSNAAQTFIGINIPFYKNTVSLDPDFSVLIDTPASDKENSICSNNKSKSKLTNGQLAGIIVGGVVFLFIVSAIIIYLISKKGSSKRAIKLRKIFGGQ